MHMVGHQDIRVHCDIMATGGLLQLHRMAGVVARREEAGLAIVAALHDVLGGTGKIGARLAGHVRRAARRGTNICLAPRVEDRESTRPRPRK